MSRWASADPASSGALLSVRDLKVTFPTEDGLVKAVDGLTFDLRAGETIGIVGESGSGKSVTSQAIMGLHRGTRAMVEGQIVFDGRDLIKIVDEDLRRMRGRDIAMIFQDPLSALHPYYTVGNQIVEAYRVHNDVTKAAARTHVIEMLDRVGIPNPQKRVDQYPHEFSGGMRQRAMIAMALVNSPRLIIADEPTTALDVTVQAQILNLLVDLQKEFGSAIIIITHDLGVVAELADSIMVMFAGKAVEGGEAEEIFYEAMHPYTWGLLQSMPRIDSEKKERLVPIAGNPPSLINPPPGCAFHPRCAFRDDARLGCSSVIPEFDISTEHPARCLIPEGERRAISQAKTKTRTA
ncbi:peptide ABC transporter ATPase [Intrasporangium oryzae NRRL B-24470]|uniref:Peptide ABC transporter ATPase n=1 Tax=Intrasporangium oryzae NRRL B-24470 TaxID=1386089 RepID=W9G8D6_9MICO|nr:ABC transporter ATP-binding protein [Intrasporangium oryzae]EWT01073.1 peptide ABC transporter ATPase [Intrasporangium oryzae NRRL B-24470]